MARIPIQLHAFSLSYLICRRASLVGNHKFNLRKKTIYFNSLLATRHTAGLAQRKLVQITMSAQLVFVLHLFEYTSATYSSFPRCKSNTTSAHGPSTMFIMQLKAKTNRTQIGPVHRQALKRARGVKFSRVNRSKTKWPRLSETSWGRRGSIIPHDGRPAASIAPLSPSICKRSCLYTPRLSGNACLRRLLLPMLECVPQPLFQICRPQPRLGQRQKPFLVY